MPKTEIEILTEKLAELRAMPQQAESIAAKFPEKKIQRDGPRRQGEAALRQAERASRRGDLAGAKHWSVVAERMAESAAQLDALEPEMDFETLERLRAELRERVRRFALLDVDQQLWEAEYAAHQEETKRAHAEGRDPPPPLRMAPGGPAIMERIARGEE